MKTIKCSVIVLSLICIALPGLVNAQGQINLSKTNAISDLPYIIIQPNGQIIVTWCEGGHFNAGAAVTYKSWTQSGGWTPMVQVADATSAHPQLAIDAEGDVHMAYWEGSSSYSRDIYYRKFAHGTWSNKSLVYDSWTQNSSWNRLDVEGNRLYVLWCHTYVKPAPLDIYLTEKTDGNGWPGTFVNVSRNSNSTSIHCGLEVKNGNVYAAWMDDRHLAGNWNIYYTERINGNWGPVTRINPGANQYLPVLDVDDSGNVHLLYTGRGGPAYYQKKTGSSWSPPKVISTAGTDITAHNFMKLANGMLHAVWRQREGEGQYIVYANGNLNGQWATPVRVSHAGDGQFPGLDVDKQGGVHVVYSDIGQGGERDVFYIRVDQVTSYPVASFTANPTQGQPPLSVNFDASTSYDPDGKIDTYAWDFGDGATGSGVKVAHIYTKKGANTAKLTVTDDENQSSEMTLTIMVGQPPVARISANPTSGSSPLTVKFNASDSTDPDGVITSYKWDFGDGHGASGPAVEHTYNANATRTAKLTVKDNDGLEDWTTVEIKISLGPVARFTCSPKQGVSPLTVNFDASDCAPSNRTSGRVVKYEWDFGDGSSSSAVKPSHTFRKTGFFTVILKITDNEGQIDSTTKDIMVYSKPTARFTMSPTSGVAPLQVFFNASDSTDADGKIVKYKWTFGDGTTGEGRTITHTYTKGGSLGIWLVVTDDDGWQHSIVKNIEVTEKPYPPADFTVTNVAHTGLFFSNYLNVLTWSKHPLNTGKINVVKRLIYKRQKGAPSFIYQVTLAPDIFSWEDNNLTDQEDMKNYIYAIRAVDSYGRESDMRKVDSGIVAAAGSELTRQDQAADQRKAVQHKKLPLVE
jgi:PKD repeat protein